MAAPSVARQPDRPMKYPPACRPCCLYTQGSAWFVHDDARRGTLAVGKLADLPVLSDNFFSVPVEQISSLESVLTMVGGRIVYAATPFLHYEE